MAEGAEAEDPSAKFIGTLTYTLRQVQLQVHECLDVTDDGLIYIESLILQLLRRICVNKPHSVADVTETVKKTFPEPLDKWALKEADLALEKKKKEKKGERGITLPVDRVHPMIKELLGYKVDYTVSLYIVAVMEYVAADTLKLAGIYVKNIKEPTITKQSIKVAMSVDMVLMRLFFPEPDHSAPIDVEPRIGTPKDPEDPHQPPSGFSSLPPGAPVTYDDVVKNLLLDEGQYIRELSLIIKVFRSPFVQLFPRTSDIEVMFSNIVEVHSLAFNFLSLLEDHQEVQEMSEKDTPLLVGGCFEDAAEYAEFDVYEKYLDEITRRNGRARLTLLLERDDVQKKLGSRGQWFVDAVRYLLPDLLMTPILHLKKHFETIKVLRNLSEDEEDRENLIQAAAQLVALKKKVDLAVASICKDSATFKDRQIDHGLEQLHRARQLDMALMQEVLKSIEGWEDVDLHQYCNKLICEGALIKQQNRRVTERYAFLFDGLLVLCKPNHRAAHEYRFKEKISIRKTTVIDKPSTEELKHYFELYQDEQLLLTLAAPSAEEKSNWMSALVGLQVRSNLDRILDSIQSEEAKNQPIPLPPPDTYPFSEPDSPENIVLEPGPEAASPPIVKGGSLIKLVERLTYHMYADPKFVRVFLLTYRSFAKPHQLLDLLIHRYSIPDLGSFSMASSTAVTLGNAIGTASGRSSVISTFSTSNFASCMSMSGSTAALDGANSPSHDLLNSSNVSPNSISSVVTAVSTATTSSSGVTRTSMAASASMTSITAAGMAHDPPSYASTSIAAAGEQGPAVINGDRGSIFMSSSGSAGSISMAAGGGVRSMIGGSVISLAMTHGETTPGGEEIMGADDTRHKRFRTDYCNPVQMRVLNTLRFWVDLHYYDFEKDPELLSQLQKFLGDIKGKRMRKWADVVNKTIARQKESSLRVEPDIMFMRDPPPPEWWLYHPDNPKGLEMNILTLSPVEIARQETLFTFELYQKVKPTEVYGKAWTKAQKEVTSPNLLRLIRQSNRFVYWLEKSMLDYDNTEERLAVFMRVMEIMIVFQELNNLNGVLEVQSALQSSSVFRLTLTLELLPNKYKKALDEAKELRDNQNKKYRERLRAINPPCVPFQGVYLSNFLKFDDGNPDFLPASPELINFTKRLRLAEIIYEIQQYQHQPYCLKVVPEIRHFLDELNPFGELDEKQFEDMLFQRSLEIQPRGMKTLQKFPRRTEHTLKSPGVKTNRTSVNPLNFARAHLPSIDSKFPFNKATEEEEEPLLHATDAMPTTPSTPKTPPASSHNAVNSTSTSTLPPGMAHGGRDSTSSLTDRLFSRHSPPTGGSGVLSSLPRDTAQTLPRGSMAAGSHLYQPRSVSLTSHNNTQHNMPSPPIPPNHHHSPIPAEYGESAVLPPHAVSLPTAKRFSAARPSAPSHGSIDVGSMDSGLGRDGDSGATRTRPPYRLDSTSSVFHPVTLPLPPKDRESSGSQHQSLPSTYSSVIPRPVSASAALPPPLPPRLSRSKTIEQMPPPYSHTESHHSLPPSLQPLMMPPRLPPKPSTVSSAGSASGGGAMSMRPDEEMAPPLPPRPPIRAFRTPPVGVRHSVSATSGGGGLMGELRGSSARRNSGDHINVNGFQGAGHPAGATAHSALTMPHQSTRATPHIQPPLTPQLPPKTYKTSHARQQSH